MRVVRRSAAALVVVVIAAGFAAVPSAHAAVGSMNLTSICSYVGGPYDGQHLWRVTSTFAADEAYTSQSPFNAAPVARTATPDRSWFLGVATTTRINYTNDSGPQQTTKAANTNTCTGPAAVITTPPDGASFALDESVLADFACTGNELVSCVGTVDDGLAIDTATAGPKTFTVTATAWDGSSSSVDSSYVVQAAPTLNGCNASGVPAALISWYPANPGSMSALKVACSWNNQPGTSQVSPSYTIHEANVVNYHNGAAKNVTNSVAAVSGATTIQLNTAANGIVGLPVAPTAMNRMITGPGIPIRTHVTSMTAGGLATLSRPTTGATPINSVLKIENANARIVDNATSGAPDLLNSTQANFTAADIGLSVSGTGIPFNTSIIAINSPAQAQLDNPLTLTGPIVSIGGSLRTGNARVITQATITSVVRINSTVADWKASDIGLKVTGTCHQNTAAAGDDTVIPANTVITATPSAANADTTGGLPNGSSGCNLVIGEANANAPVNGDVVAQQGVQLNLSPGLVAGSADCADDQPEGFGIVAKWYNPGSFQGAGLTNSVPGSAVGATATPTKAIGQLFFDTSAADFAGFIVERRSFTAGDPIGSAHFDVVFPFAPTTLAMCPSTLNSPGLTSSLSVNSITTSQSTQPSGTGRPGTGQVRNILPSATGGYTVTAFVDSQGANTFSPASAFNRICIYPVGFPNAANFQCGPG